MKLEIVSSIKFTLNIADQGIKEEKKCSEDSKVIDQLSSKKKENIISSSQKSKSKWSAKTDSK